MKNLNQNSTSINNRANQMVLTREFFIVNNELRFGTEDSVFNLAITEAFNFCKKELSTLEGQNFLSMMKAFLEVSLKSYSIDIKKAAELFVATFTKKETPKVKILGKINLDKIEGGNKKCYSTLDEESADEEAERLEFEQNLEAPVFPGEDGGYHDGVFEDDHFANGGW